MVKKHLATKNKSSTTKIEHDKSHFSSINNSNTYEDEFATIIYDMYVLPAPTCNYYETGVSSLTLYVPNKQKL